MNVSSASYPTCFSMQEIQNAREPSNGTAGTIPPAQEKEGYVADLDE